MPSKTKKTKDPFVLKHRNQMTREELIAQNKTLGKIIRTCVPGSFVAQIHFLQKENETLKKQIAKFPTRKYYIVGYECSEEFSDRITTGNGNMAMSFADGDFYPKKALNFIKEIKSKNSKITLSFWQEISEKAYNDWNQATSNGKKDSR